VVARRECLRRKVLDALEVLSRRLCRAGRLAEGVEAALLSFLVEPLRDSAYRALVDAHFAEGNFAEVHRVSVAHRRILRDELGVDLGGRPWWAG
jgi:hypothetical protein